jgi:hypothetical protein
MYYFACWYYFNYYYSSLNLAIPNVNYSLFFNISYQRKLLLGINFIRDIVLSVTYR